MDIHKPKAAHSWREFLIEIGTIICGILIALGLEQVVEAVHRGSEVKEAREALYNEISENAARLTLSVQENRCILAQLDAYAVWARGGPKPSPFRYYMPALRTNTWETVKSGAVPHMGLEERVNFAAHYDAISNQVAANAQQLTFHWPLIAFAELPSLGADQSVALLRVVSQEREQARRIIGTALFTIDRMRDWKLPEPTSRGVARARKGVAWVCDPAAPYPFADH